jgi:two-component system response regulator YesN
MKYQILIVDDEPLVQVGLKSMLSREFEEIEILGTASNGRDALTMIEERRPDIVIADIKMPIMTGLELIRESEKRFGAVPAFIMLTAYEDFHMVRQALASQAVDYLVKIELNSETLHDAIQRAIHRVDQYKKLNSWKEQKTVDNQQLESFRQKFMLRMLNRLFTSKEELEEQAAELKMDFHYNRYIAVYASMQKDLTHPAEKEQNLTLFSSCFSMCGEILNRYAQHYMFSNDLRHFTAIFYFKEDQPVADRMQSIQEACSNAHTMIRNYFNVPVTFGIGTAVATALDIATSFEEAKSAEMEADEQNAVRMFSHIVGANRRSGKDKLIQTIQDYIDENLNGKLQLNEIAEAFGLSPAYLSVLFKKNTDIGFSEYVYTKKIEKAKELLLSDDMKIYEVADTLGFESAYYFSKVFKKVVGLSPREFIQSKIEE